MDTEPTSAQILERLTAQGWSIHIFGNWSPAGWLAQAEHSGYVVNEVAKQFGDLIYRLERACLR